MRGKDTNLLMVGGILAVGALAYVAWRGAARPVVVPSGTPGGGRPAGGGGGGGGMPGGVIDMPMVPVSRPTLAFPGWNIGPDLRSALAGSPLSLAPMYGFTRIGMEDNPVWVLRGQGFTLL